MKKYLFFILLVGVVFGQEALEKYNKKYSNGIGYSTDKDIYFSALSAPLGIRFEPFFGYNVSGQNTDKKNNNIDIDAESKLILARLGLGILIENIVDNELRLFSYYGLRFANTKNTTKLKQNDPINLDEVVEIDTSFSNFSISPVIGSHVYVNDRISIGGELQLNIAQDEELSVNQDLNGDSDKVTYFQYGLSSKIFIRLYF